MAITLFENQTGNATSSSFSGDGGYLVVKLSGTLDGANITFEMDFHDNDFKGLLDENNAIQTMTSVGIKSLIRIKPSVRYRAVINNAGGSTNLTLKVA